MIRLKTSATTLAIVVGLPLAAFAQTSAAGDWELTLTTPQGSNTVNVSFAQDGDKVTGTLSSPMGSVPLTGTDTAGDLKATASIDIQGMALDLAFAGKVAGDTLNGTVKFGDFGEFPFTGKRAASKAAAAPTASAAAAAGAGVAGNAAGSATGKWDITLSIAGAGEFPMTATFTQTADKVSGTLSSQAGDVQVNGTMTGNTLKLDFTADTPQGAIPVSMTGTLGAAGFAGKASIAGMGEADWTAKRAQ